MSTYLRLISRTQKSAEAGSDVTSHINTMAIMLHDFLIIPEFYYLPLEISSQVFLNSKEKLSKEESRYVIERYAFQLFRDAKETVELIQNSPKETFSGIDLMNYVKDAMKWPEKKDRVHPIPPVTSNSPPKPFLDIANHKFDRDKQKITKICEKQCDRLYAVVNQIEKDTKENEFKVKQINDDKEDIIKQLRDRHYKDMSEHQKEIESLEAQIENVKERIQNPLSPEQHKEMMEKQDAANKLVIKQMNAELNAEVQKLHTDLLNLANKRNDPERQREEARRKLEEKQEKKEAIRRQKEEERQKRQDEIDKQKAFEQSLVEVPQKLLDNFRYPKKFIKVQPIYKPKDTFVMPKHAKTFFDAIYLGDTERLMEFIRKNPKIVNEYGEGRILPLHAAVKHNRVAVAKALIENGADVNAKDQLGRTPLHYASIYETNEIIALLKGTKVDIDIKDKEGFTALDLLKEREKMRKEAYDTIKVINRRRMAEIFKRWPDIVTYKYNGGMQLIHVAAYYGMYETVEMLLQWGADLEAVDDKGNTPFHYAIIGGEYDCIQFMIDHGANLHALNNDKKQPFDYYQ